MTTPLRKERHSVTDLKIHLVCVTKYRRSVFTAESLAVIESSFHDVAKKMNFQIQEFIPILEIVTTNGVNSNLTRSREKIWQGFVK